MNLSNHHRAAGRPRLLLVDDEPRVCAALAGVFVSEGYEVAYQNDGEDAVGGLRAGECDLVLLDLNMPCKDGWERLEQIRAIDPLLPVIIITARPDQHSKAAAAGVAALMEKPLDIPSLLEAVSRLTGGTVEEPRAGLGARAGWKSVTSVTSRRKDQP